MGNPLSQNVTRVQMFLAGQSAAASVLGSHLHCFEAPLVRFPVKHCFVVDGGVAAAIKTEGSLRAAQQIWFVGDGDSARAEAMSALDRATKFKRMDLPTHKDVSDFGAALDVLAAEEHGPLIVEVFGGLGGRLDHEFINLLEIERFVTARKAATVCLCEPAVLIASASVTLTQLQQKNFSIVKATAPLVLAGALYDGKTEFNRPSHGLSNVVIKDTLTLSLQASAPHFYVSVIAT